MSADSTGRALVLAIGLDGYQALPRLVGAARGAESLARLLWRRFGFEASVLTNQQATRGAVNRELDRLSQADRVIIYYAGRTLTDQTLALYTTDPNIPSTGLEIARLVRTFNALAARHALLILDAPIAPWKDLPITTQAESASPDRSRTILCAGPQAWQTRDLWSDNDTSLFTAQIAFGLRGNAADVEGRITVSRLIDYVRADMQRVSNGSWLPWYVTLPGTAGDWMLQAETPVELPEALTDGLRNGFPALRNQAVSDIAHLIEVGDAQVIALAISKLREVAADNDLLNVRKAAENELLVRNISVTEQGLPPWREPAPDRPGSEPLAAPSEEAPPPLPGDRRSTVITIGIAIGVLATAMFVILHFSP